ncbi:hypothetical protein ES703_07972 [subsurface metagenome]
MKISHIIPIAAMLVLLPVATAAGCMAPTSEPAPTAAPPTRPPEIPDGWNLYHEKGMEISFFYPPEWGEVIDYADYFLKLISSIERQELSKEEKARMKAFEARLRDSGPYLAFSNLDMEWTAHIKITSVEKMQSVVSATFAPQEEAPEGSGLMLIPLFGYFGRIFFHQYPGLAEHLPQMVGDIAALSEGASPKELEDKGQPVFSLFANGIRYMGETTYLQMRTYDGQLSGVTETGREGWDVAARDYWDCILTTSNGEHLVYISFSLESEEQQTQFSKFAKSVTLSPAPAPAPAPAPEPTGTKYFVFPDDNLQAAVKSQLFKYHLGIAPDEGITKEELARLGSLDLPDKNIKDLSGIENCSNLASLLLTDNQISDLSPITSLTKLEGLHMGGNQISDISPLAALTNLRKVSLNSNQISDITPLSSLDKLRKLHLSNNQVRDISPLTSLTQLDTLTIINNQIRDIDPLKSLTDLRYLTLSNNQISDVSSLASLTNLEYLEIDNNQISYITPLSSLAKLYRLQIGNNQISDISPLASLTNLGELKLGNNQISDVSPLASLINLLHLRINDNQISNISFLASLQELVTLYLGNNQISDISSLSSMTSLRTLDLSNNQVSDISSLASLIRIQDINLQNNNISDISPLVENYRLDSKWLLIPHVYLENNYLNLLEGSEDLKAIRELEERGVEITYIPQTEGAQEQPQAAEEEKEEVVIPTPALPLIVDGVVNFPDEKLDTIIRTYLGKGPSENITTAELSHIIELEDTSGQIADLSGIQFCSGLNKLQISGSQISDTSPLVSLINLTWLKLSYSQISDISPISSLSNLEILHLYGNQISDLSPFASLTKLRLLFLGENQISNLSPLASLTNLKVVSLISNQISDISPLVQNPGLGNGDNVRLRYNNLDLSEGSEDLENIRILEARGVEVIY